MDGARHAALTGVRFPWIAATAIGWSTIGIGHGWLPVGFAVGLLQWLVLRRRTPISPLWVPATGVTWWAGIALEDRFVHAWLVPDLRWIAATGAVVGLLQWMLLGSRHDRTLLWVPVNAASAFLSWWAGALVGFDLYSRWWCSDSCYLAGAAAAGGLVAGVITGWPLPGLLRRRAPLAIASPAG